VPSQKVEELIQKFDEIALGHCFCRHYKDMLGTPCKQTDERETCFTFGKSARFTSEQGFTRMISKKEALDVLKRAEEAGLVHKAYHPNFDTSKDETSICNCCRCCCANGADSMIAPISNVTNFLSSVNEELCIGCGTCVKYCHTYAAYLKDNKKAGRKEELCIGCGVCAHFCPQNAISMVEGERIVRIPPKRK
jgi:Pyruvate/2-oxoacid:ferredoxin oxidoreductase delta subunit